MEIIFHTGKGSDQSLREFDEKRADFLMRELRNMKVQELKALLRMLLTRLMRAATVERCTSVYSLFSAFWSTGSVSFSSEPSGKTA